MIIDLRDASENDRRHGITHRGATIHQVTGHGVHNPRFPHSVTVWDNTHRPNDGKRGRGAYIGPDGRATDAQTTIIFTSERPVISMRTDPHARTYSEPVTVGDMIQLRYPDGTLSDSLQVTARDLADPILTPEK